MKEALLQYAWHHKMFYNNDLLTNNGESVEIIDVGQLNRDAGPDFFNAKIKIGNTIWAGNVEIHVKSSDWFHHHHEQDIHYQTIILHVVSECDASIQRLNGEEIPQLVLPYFRDLDEKYEQLIHKNSFVACAQVLDQIPPFAIKSWLNSLLIERLEQKSIQIERLLNLTQYDWEESFYMLLARNFGMNLNADSFEQLAKSLPNNLLGKHKENLFQIEALLFGQSGFLDEIQKPKDEYVLKLKHEAMFLRKKYDLTPLNAHSWKMLRLRPINFPQVRIAQLAMLIHQSSKLFSKIINNQDINYYISLFQCAPSDYWLTHYSFEHPSRPKKKTLGINSIKILIINTLVPYLFYYGKYKGNQSLQDKAVEMLDKLPPEKNFIIDGWSKLNIAARSAFDSQALIQLKNEYCDPKKCLQCRFGYIALTSKEIKTI
ncbi:MAG: DUF2851 family protein [Microbacter sp.]